MYFFSFFHGSFNPHLGSLLNPEYETLQFILKCFNVLFLCCLHAAWVGQVTYIHICTYAYAHTHTHTHACTHTHYMHILTVQKSQHYKILGPCQVFLLTLVYTATPWSGELLSPSVHVSIKQYSIVHKFSVSLYGFNAHYGKVTFMLALYMS